MAKGQVKKVQIQADQMVFALDIGTRSVIGMVGVVEDDKVKVIAIEKEEHNERAMIDGQIENIDKVSALAGKVKKRLENRLGCKLKRVCVAAAGRALRTRRTEYEIELPGKQLIDEEVISRLEAGAVGKIEEAFDAENSAEDESRRFYLVGYTVCQYYLDQYRMSSLKDHRGQRVKVDLIATFLPSEVVESLYTTMNKIGLEVVSVTLEPIAAINAAIPENLRLLNLVLVDIGAGTSDIAACTDGSVTGYTMATVAGDEITETIMREYLVDFRTAETMKAQLEQDEAVTFIDILGFERELSKREILQCIQHTSEILCKEIAEKILEINGNAPSALFLAGGGSKLSGLKEGLTAALQMDANRVAIAGNNFRLSAFSDEYDLNNPEYATPLGIVVSSGLNLINDSFRVTLNGRPAKLFRSGSFTALNLLMMNGYSFQDVLGRPGMSLTVTVNGKRKAFYGTAAQPASLLINKKEGKLSTIIHAGDCIDFVPAVPGIPARACLGDIKGAAECQEITLNGEVMPLETPLKIGDVIRIRMPKPEDEDTDNIENVSKTEDTDDIDNTDNAENTSNTVNAGGAADMDNAVNAGNTADTDNAVNAGSAVDTDNAVNAGSAADTDNALNAGSAVNADSAVNTDSALNADSAVNTDNIENTGNLKGTDNVTEDGSIAVEESPGDAAQEKSPGDTVQEKFLDDGGTEETSVKEGLMEDWVEDGQLMLKFDAKDREEPAGVPVKMKERELVFQLNGLPIRLPPKPDGSPYYLMDMIQYSGINLNRPKGKINLLVNGEPGMFQQALAEGDVIIVEEEQIY